jgi:hypothetical protein
VKSFDEQFNTPFTNSGTGDKIDLNKEDSEAVVKTRLFRLIYSHQLSLVRQRRRPNSQIRYRLVLEVVRVYLVCRFTSAHPFFFLLLFGLAILFPAQFCPIIASINFFHLYPFCSPSVLTCFSRFGPFVRCRPDPCCDSSICVH